MDLTLSELKKFSKAELLEMYNKVKAEYENALKNYNYFNMMQLAYKLVLNGCYGFFSNKNSSMYNAEIANAITGMGRDCIQYMLRCIENYFYNEWHEDINTHKLLGLEYIAEIDGKWFILDRNFKKVSYGFVSFEKIVDKFKLSNTYKTNIEGYTNIYEHHICSFDKVEKIDENPKFEKDVDDLLQYVGENPCTIYSDTDSVEYSTKIITEKDEITIEELYNRNLINGSAGITLKGHESVKCTDRIINYSKSKGLYFNNARRIIRHKVSKEKWCLKTTNGKCIYITNDHSLIIFRDGEKLEIKPKDVLKTDKVLTIKNKI